MGPTAKVTLVPYALVPQGRPRDSSQRYTTMKKVKMQKTKLEFTLLKIVLGTLLPVLFFMGCAPSLVQYKEIGASGSIDTVADVRGFASVEIHASKQKVWEALVRAKEWPEWHGEIKSVSVDGALIAGKNFIWGPTFPKIKSEVVLCDPEKTLLWVGTMLHFKAIHSWKLEERDGITILSTEESLHGAMVTWIFGQRKLNDNLKVWLLLLKNRAEAKTMNQPLSFQHEIEK
jgi:hypothetical protein